MKCKYSIDTFQYFALPDNSAVIVSGWVFAEEGGRAPEVRAYVNGKPLDAECQRIARKDVQQNFTHYQPELECGFRLRAPLEPGMSVTSVKVMAELDGSEKTILSRGRASLAKARISDPFITGIDDIQIQPKDEQWQYMIKGWAVSRRRGEVRFRVYDSAKRPVEFTERGVNRNDLYLMGVITKEETNCGFAISFTASREQNYTFVVTDGTTKRGMRLNADRVERSAKFARRKRLVMNVFSDFDADHVRRGIKYLRKKGPRQTIKRLIKGESANGMPYAEWYKQHHVTEETLRKQRKTTFDKNPLISIIVPTYKTPIDYLKEMIESVRAQTYPNWELCIGDGSEGDKELEAVLEEYAREDKRIHYKILEKNMGISGNTNGALALATGDYVGLLDHDDVLSPDALFEIVSALQKEDYDVFYTDEDKVSADLKEYSDPNFKPDYSEDLLRSHNYITHFFVARRSIAEEIGGFNSEFDGAQDYDFIFRCVEKSSKICHISKILYHWRVHEDSTAGNPASKLYAYEAGKKAIEAHYKRLGVKAEVEMMPLWGMYHTTYAIPENAFVSVIIPNKDHAKDLRTCVNSLYEKNDYSNFEIIIVENNSQQKETFSLYDELREERANLSVIKWEERFNYAAINNFAAKQAKGDYLLFLNNDTEVITEYAVREMLGCCARPEVGVVGAKLLYEDDTVQHAGIVIGFGGFAGHVFTGIGRNDYGFMLRPVITCNYSAVTGACMMVSRDVFEAVGGFSEEFEISLNDVDLCLKIRAIDKLVVYDAHSLWYHFESKSRGYEDSVEKKERFEKEIQLFQTKWAGILRNGDPYYNKNFPIEFAPFHLG